MKLGLGDSYDNVSILPKKIRAYGDLTKPASSIPIMLAVPLAGIIYGELNDINGLVFIFEHYKEVIFASITLFLLHGGSQALNMSEDAHIDIKTDHKSNRPIPAGVVSVDEARALAIIMITAGIIRALLINISFGVFGIVLAVFGIFYNLKPIRAKKILWVNLVWQAASRGLLLYPATFAVFGDPLNPVAWALGIVAFFLVLSMQNTADFADVDIDAKFNIITPAVYHGKDNLVIIMGILAGLMFVVLTGFIYINMLPFYLSLYLLTIPIFFSLVWLSMYPDKISSISDNNFTWYVYYTCLAGMYFLPAIEMLLK